MRHLAKYAAALAVWALACSPAAGQVFYTESIIQGGCAYPEAINDAGQATGMDDASPYGQRAFVWSDAGGMRYLPTLGGTVGWGHGINDLGQVVGWSDLPGDTSRHAFLWDPDEGILDLGTLPGMTSSEAWGINEAGQVVGTSSTADGHTHAFLWDAQNGMRDLGTLGGTSSWARGINDAGQVVGAAKTADDLYEHAYLWDAQGGMRDLGTLSGTSSSANGINNVGAIAGRALDAQEVGHAVVWQNGGITDLGEGESVDINDAGQVVGYDGWYAPVLWRDGTPYVLTDIVYQSSYYTSVGAINSSGQITTSGGSVIFGSWVLTPTGPDFRVAASPGSQSVVHGAATDFTITLTALGGFVGTVDLSVAGSPAGASATLNPPSIDPAGSSTLTVTTADTTPPGTYTLAVTGTSGPLRKVAQVSLTVLAALAPSNLAATAVSSSQINLAWVNNATNATGIAIERSTDGSNFAEIARVGPTVSSYPNPRLKSGRTYWYRVRAFNASGYSPYSNVASARTPGGRKR